MRRFAILCALLSLFLLPSPPAGAATPPQTHPMPATTTVTPGKPVVTQIGGRMVVTAAERVDAPLTGVGGQPASPDGHSAFTCSFNVAEAYTSTGPTMWYWSEVDCSKGTPIRNVTVLQTAHVNTPSAFTTVASQPDECNGANPCTSPEHPYDASATQLLQACAEPVVKGTDALLYDLGPYCFVYPYNNLGAGYPATPSYAPFTIPFPGPSYAVCDDYPNLTPPCPREDPGVFRSAVETRYANNGWVLPSCPNGVAYEAHHIKPLSWGGGNSDTNGVLLCPDDHTPFTNWWGYSHFTPS